MKVDLFPEGRAALVVCNPPWVPARPSSPLEHGIYDRESGQLLTGSYMDYTMPRADDLPDFQVGMTVTPCPSNPLGVKGCGEAGAIAAPAAVVNAITDALGIKEFDMPATPESVWRAARWNGPRGSDDFMTERVQHPAEKREEF